MARDGVVQESWVEIRGTPLFDFLAFVFQLADASFHAHSPKRLNLSSTSPVLSHPHPTIVSPSS